MKILLVEDNPADVRLVREALRNAPGEEFELTQRGQLADALADLDQCGFDAVLLDLGLPDSQGIETLAKVHHHTRRRAPVIVLTGLNDEAVAVQAVRQGAQDYLPKTGLSNELLKRTLRYAVERHRGQDALRESEARQRELAGEAARQANELARSNDELRVFTRLAVDRELRMVELKRQVNQLSAQLGRAPPFPLPFLAEEPKAA
jgi:DNA-binding response OmpR family regulator